jgi:hypothetical protein
MAQHSASPKRAEDRLATRVSKSPPGGLVAGGIAILVMLLALAGVLPRPTFLVGAAGLIAVAYKLDKRFKADAPPDAAPPDVAAPGAPAAPEVSRDVDDVGAAPVAPAPAHATPAVARLADAKPAAATSPPPSPPPTTAAAPAVPVVAPPSLLPITDLKAEHARLTRELTDRVDDDEDVRFEKFMRLRRLDEEIERQQGAPPG